MSTARKKALEGFTEYNERMEARKLRELQQEKSEQVYCGYDDGLILI